MPMPVEALRKQWDARAPSAPLRPAMMFEGDALVLGAGTRLAMMKRVSRPEGQHDASADEGRLVALLSAAHRRSVGRSELAHIRSALAKQSAGETTLASIHLALSGLSKLQHPSEDARRLFMADGLMRAGVSPRIIVEALELDVATLEGLERRYNPDQPRVPAGSGDTSGQWTSGDAAGAPQSEQRIQIADNSSDWGRFLNPIGEAEAAQPKKPPFNGLAPNLQHDRGVADAIAAYKAKGFIIASAGPTYVMIPGFPTPRYYDFVARDPVTGDLIGVEVKTTSSGSIAFDVEQVQKDVALLSNGGVDVPALDGRIKGVAYETFCDDCSVINFRKTALVLELLWAGVRIRFYSWPGGASEF